MSNIGLPVPTDYKSSSTDLLYALIEYSNPGFTQQFPKGTLQFSAPSTVTVVEEDVYKTDTSVTIFSAAGAGKIGNQTVRYRRINMAAMFKSMVVKLDDYSSTTGLVDAVWRNSFRTKYGIAIPDTDFSDTPVSGMLASGNTVIGIKATSLCYKGNFTLNWTKGKRLIGDIITDANRALVGRLYPGGNDFTTEGRKPQGEFMTYCQDASAISAVLETIVNASSSYTDTQLTAVVNFLLANTVRTDWNKNVAGSVVGGIAGMNWFRYSLPNIAVPDANSAKYNRCIVIPSYTTAWFAGNIIIHYNV